MDAIELRRLRAVPLESVLEGFGAKRHPRDPKHNWRTDAGRITVTGERFFDHTNEVGGGGAIDLTLHLMGRDFKHAANADLMDAARWLGALDRITVSASQPAALTPSPSASAAMPPPVPDPSRSARVRWYLTAQRALPTDLVDQAMQRGAVFADGHGNAIFRLHDETGQTIGFEKRGTWGKPYHAVHGDKGLFVVGNPTSGVAAFVESGIEALSYKALRGDVLAVSTTGNAVELPERMAQRLRERGFAIVAAFNADFAGDRFAERFAQRLGGHVERDRPQAKDWNDTLQIHARPAPAPAPRMVVREGAKTPDRTLELTR